MKILHICILFFVVLFGGVGCHAPQKTTKSEQHIDGSNDEDLDRTETSCMDDANNIGWRMVSMDAFNAEGMSRIKMFKVDKRSLHNLFTQKSNSIEAFLLSLPFSQDDQFMCLQFEIQPSRDLSYEQQKRKAVFYFKGMASSNSTNIITIEYDLKNGMKATAEINGEWRKLQSVEYAGDTYYVAYSHRDAELLNSMFDIRE